MQMQVQAEVQAQAQMQSPSLMDGLCKALGLNPATVQTIDLYITRGEVARIDVTFQPDERQMQAVTTFVEEGKWQQATGYIRHAPAHAAGVTA